MIKHLESSVREVASAATLVLRSSGSESSLQMLEQALELLDMSCGAVDNEVLARAGDEALRVAVDFLGVANSARAGESSAAPDMQTALQSLLTACAVVESACLEVQAPQAPQQEAAPIEAPAASGARTHRFSKEHVEPPQEAPAVSSQRPLLELGQRELSSLHRSLLGLDDDSDRAALDCAGIASYLSNQVPLSGKPTGRTGAVDSTTAAGAAFSGDAAGDAAEGTDHARDWTLLAAAARKAGASQGAPVALTCAAASAAAASVGELAREMGAVLGCLQESLDTRRAVRTQASRLPTFARRDAEAAQAVKLAGVESRAAAAAERLTRLAAPRQGSGLPGAGGGGFDDDGDNGGSYGSGASIGYGDDGSSRDGGGCGALALLRDGGVLERCCGALECLALAWQVHASYASQAEAPARGGAAGAAARRHNGPRAAGAGAAAARAADEAVGALEAEVGEALGAAASVVGAAVASLQDVSARLRNGVAAASASLLPSSSTSRAPSAGATSQFGGGGSPGEGACARPFDVYSRDPRVGPAARRVEGKARKAAELGSVHLSRHNEYEPSFADARALVVGIVAPGGGGGGDGGGGSGGLRGSGVRAARGLLDAGAAPGAVPPAALPPNGGAGAAPPPREGRAVDRVPGGDLERLSLQGGSVAVGLGGAGTGGIGFSAGREFRKDPSGGGGGGGGGAGARAPPAPPQPGSRGAPDLSGNGGAGGDWLATAKANARAAMAARSGGGGGGGAGGERQRLQPGQSRPAPGGAGKENGQRRPSGGVAGLKAAPGLDMGLQVVPRRR